MGLAALGRYGPRPLEICTEQRFQAATRRNAIEYGCGTLFKLDAGGKEKVLHEFRGSDGEFPEALLTRDAAGNLYGTTYLTPGNIQWRQGRSRRQVDRALHIYGLRRCR